MINEQPEIKNIFSEPSIVSFRKNASHKSILIKSEENTRRQNESYFQPSPKCAIRSEFIPLEIHYFDQALVLSLVSESDLFGVEGITEIVRQCPRGKACGIDVLRRSSRL